jgi:hypothetical protein
MLIPLTDIFFCPDLFVLPGFIVARGALARGGSMLAVPLGAGYP